MANMHPQANSEPEHSSAARSEELTRAPLLNDLISAAFALRSQQRYALHPVEATLRHLRAEAETNGTESGGQFDFEQAESVYRRGAQGLRLSQIPKLPEKISELSRLGNVDRAGRKAVRYWAEANDLVIPEGYFFERWATQGRLGGAEHQVFHDEESGRWFKRLYFGVNQSTLGDYLVRMRLHAALFPETSYRLEGFTINARSKELAPVVSQPHVEVDLTRPLVTREATHDLMAGLGFAAIELMHDGIQYDGYFAYLHPHTGILAHDLHDENVVHLAGSEELVLIDPYISLARRGAWAALKISEIGWPPPPDDSPGP